LLLGAGQR
jgi:hypothetical protein